MEQLLFYQHNVQKFFLRHLEKYDGVVVPLSIGTTFPDGTQGFLRALFGHDNGKYFAIDPRTPLFQKSWDRSKARPPHEKMASVFGEPVVTEGLKTHLSVAAMKDESVQSITAKCVQYQIEFRLREQDLKKIEKYKKLLDGEQLPPIANPQVIVPPYFEFDSVGDAWYEISLKCVDYARHLVPASTIRPVLHFSRFAPSAKWADVVARLAEYGVSTVFLYPNEFREHDASSSQLVAYRAAVEEFGAAGIEPYALHGGYLSIALSKFGLGGFGNGVGYGEWRNSNYHRGGTADKRIYIPKLHKFVEPAQAQALIDFNSEYFASDSDLLAECVASETPLGSLSLEQTLDHFMECRAAEMAFVENHGIEEVCEELDATKAQLEELGPIVEVLGGGLSKWANVLKA